MKKVLKAFNRLKYLYKIGLVDYPRVENDYFNEADYFAHPKLFGFSNEFKPVKEKKVFIKRHPLFYLFHKRILSPALIENYVAFFKKKKKYEEDNEERYEILKKLTTFEKIKEKYRNFKIKLFYLEKRIYKSNDIYIINQDFTIKKILMLKSALKRKENNIKYIGEKSLKEIFKEEEKRIIDIKKTQKRLKYEKNKI